MGSTIENWGFKTKSQFLSGPAKYSFVNLSKVHTGRYTQRIQNNVNRSSVFEEWHVFFTHNPCNDTLITMSSGHLITDSNLTFFSDVNFSHLNNTIWKLISNSCNEFYAVVFTEDFFELDVVVVDDFVDDITLVFICSPLVGVHS